jgi:hypothetical protein
LTVEKPEGQVGAIMIRAFDHNGQLIDDAHLVESTAPAAANVVGSFIARRRGLEFIPRLPVAGN